MVCAGVATKRLNNQKARFDFVVAYLSAEVEGFGAPPTHKQPLQSPQGNTNQEVRAEATPTAVPGKGTGGQKTYTALAADASATG